MIFVYKTKVDLKIDEKTVAVAEIQFDDIEDGIECAYGLWRKLVLRGEKNESEV